MVLIEPAFNPILVWFQRLFRLLPRQKRAEGTFNPILVWFQRIPTPAPSKINVYFQSHFGLISTKKLKKLGIEPDTAFNPILVWFQLTGGEKIPVVTKNFQSHFGLISTLWVFKLFIGCLHFQSHFGLISTLIFLNHVEKNKRSFNPILVWFQLIR